MCVCSFCHFCAGFAKSHACHCGLNRLAETILGFEIVTQYESIKHIYKSRETNRDSDKKTSEKTTSKERLRTNAPNKYAKPKTLCFRCYHRCIVGQMENKIPSMRTEKKHAHTINRPRTINSTMITMNRKSNVTHFYTNRGPVSKRCPIQF